MAEDEIRFVGNFQRLEFNPGDKFVIQCDEHISVHMVERLKAAWQEFMGDEGSDNLIVLSGGLKLGVISKNPAPQSE